MQVRTIAPSEQAQEPDTAEAKPYGIRDSRPAGPGWFESSWELLAGLEVIEGPGTVSEATGWRQTGDGRALP
jgi:hypothetical protein